ncbi:MAG: citrate synthase [Anaerolineae bacterium]|nr:citrate synthase [Anaerolineae bacterium]
MSSKPETASADTGLEGIIIARTQKSKVDGLIGKLQYHGYNVFDLAPKASFEEVAYLLWYNKLPNQSELDGLKASLRLDRQLRPEIIELMKVLPRTAHPMAVLRTAVSALSAFDPDADDNGPEANLKKAHRLTAVIPTIIATWERIRIDKPILFPQKTLDHTENFLFMINGAEPDETAVKALESYLVLLADHGMNASTFSSRVTTSTLSDMYSAVTTAIGTLKGPAHGGANQKAMETFREIGSPENVDAWFEGAIANKRRIAGIGHRVYKTMDPRATVLREDAKALSLTNGGSKWFDIAERLEQKTREHPYFIERNLYPNVDYFSAIVLYELGIPDDQFTPLFAMSRVIGWTAHIMEQWENNRLIRPRAEYVGPEDQPWLPLEERG